MRRLIITPIFWFGLILSAHGMSVRIPITTNNLDQGRFVFAISTNSAANGIAFHVTITAKREDIPSDSQVDLWIVTRTKEGGGTTTSGEEVKPAVPVALKRGSRVWAADFTVSNDLLKKPGLCFAFTEFAHSIIDGKSVARPSADYYQIQLRDFVNL